LDYLEGVRLNCQPSVFYLNSREYHEQRQGAAGASRAAEGKSGKKKKGLPVKPSYIAEPEPTVEQLYLEMKQALHRGTFRVVAGLERDRLYAVPPLLSATLPLRFHRRFGALMRLDQPQALTYENFVASTDVAHFAAADLYAASAESFHCAKLIGERLLGKLKVLAAGEGGETGEDRMASVRASVGIASSNCDVAAALQVPSPTAVSVCLRACVGA
jgi:hypothetical protein